MKYKATFHLVIKVLLIIMTTSMIFWTCKGDKQSAPDVNGKMIKEIKSEIVLFDDGSQLSLNEDSISKVFYLVRHAEKDTSVKVEPPLSSQGLARATKLADMMRGTRVDAIYSTMTVRTMWTVDSLADIKAMSILPYDNKTLKETITNVKVSEDFNRIFMVGHSNTVPAIANTLAGKEIFNKTFDESDYGNFIIVVAKKSGNSDVYKLRY